MTDSPTMRVLVVDDNQASAKMLGWTVELFGAEYKLAFDGENALALASEFRPDVVLLDIGIPGMNGYDICRAMRADPALAGTVFIAQTGWGEEEHKQRSRDAGFHHHLVKPVDLQTLQGLLQSIRDEKSAAA